MQDMLRVELAYLPGGQSLLSHKEVSNEEALTRHRPAGRERWQGSKTPVAAVNARDAVVKPAYERKKGLLHSN
jgi:hypothetical protein